MGNTGRHHDDKFLWIKAVGKPQTECAHRIIKER